MAWVTKFEMHEARGRIQPSQVVGRVKVFDLPEGSRVVQIDTNGSEHRVNPGKQSQTLRVRKRGSTAAV